MFEISGDDISKLSDGDLRSLVARLAIAELESKGCPRSSVTAGGNQDAPDGGIDVRVECPSEIADPDFVPRRHTGFQVKKPDMHPSAISAEMSPNGKLRDTIRNLAIVSGSYVIVSSQGSVADKPLSDRRLAMRKALNELPFAEQLHTDFYDRDRLATWVNKFPGTVVWVRSKVGRPMAGWSSIENWDGGGARAHKPYLSNDKDCLIDESSREREHLPVLKGIERLRARLRIPKQCIRFIGLSGLGKTRLVQALFEEGVGDGPLDSSLAVYTDYSEETSPTARDMARELIASGRSAILIVDNCNPATHTELARLCSNDGSKVSLITVEYDVRDDEPEHTDVFRLQSASPELVTEWIKQGFPSISEVDREKIAEFSDGNFRVARALAETLGKDETLGRLKSHELFERIFHQRNQPDQDLLKAAEDLSLLYSIDGENVSADSELAQVGAFRGVDAQTLYEKLVEMRQRGVAQARGRFRAILPQAIANPLASRALARIPPARFDEVCSAMTPRMLKSVSRRLGFLHDSPVAQAAVIRWLQKDGPLGDLMTLGSEGFHIISNIAPVAPDALLAKFERELVVTSGAYAPGRHECIRLIKAISYDAHLFDRAILLLARFVPAGSKENNNGSGCVAFSECFHIHLSGTQATPAQRRAAIKRFVASKDPNLRSCAHIAMRALLQSNHFTSMGSFDFGARSRDWGWEPKFNKDIWEWFEEGIKLVVELAPEADARVLLANSLRGLWHYPGCLNAINDAATVFMRTRPWIEGWIACRAALQFDGNDMPVDARTCLEKLISRLQPPDLLNKARAVVLNRIPGSAGWDFADGENDEGAPIKSWQKADLMAVDVGQALANDAAVRAQFFTELLVGQAQRAFQCGLGLARGTNDLNSIWSELVASYEASKATERNPTALGGFLNEAHQRDQNFTQSALENAIHNSDLLPVLPYFQACVGLDSDGIARLSRAINEGNMCASHFFIIANGSVSKSPEEPLAALLEGIAALPKGVEVALEILNMRLFSRNKEEKTVQSPRLSLVGRDLLAHVQFNKDAGVRDYAVHTVIKCCLTGKEGQVAAQKLCSNIRSAFDSHQISSHDLRYTLNSLFEAQPFVALDTFMLPKMRSGFFDDEFAEKPPLGNMDPAILDEWASRAPETRYPLLGKNLNLFTKSGNEENDLSPLFLSLLEKAPDKKLFLGKLLDRLHPRSWTGSLADILIRRKAQILKLTQHSDEQVRATVNELLPELDRWIEHEQGRDRAEEESFE